MYTRRKKATLVVGQPKKSKKKPRKTKDTVAITSDDIEKTPSAELAPDLACAQTKVSGPLEPENSEPSPSLAHGTTDQPAL